MNLLIRLVVLSFFLMFTLKSMAVIVDNGIFTTDTDTGLDWLDLSETTAEAYVLVEDEFEVGGDYEGWMYATGSQLSTLFNNSGLITSVDLSTSIVQVDTNATQQLMNYLGITFNSSGSMFTTGYISDSPSQLFHYYGGIKFDVNANIYTTQIYSGSSHTHVTNISRGSYLVRSTSYVDPVAVPEPSAWIIFILSLSCMIFLRKNKL